MELHVLVPQHATYGSNFGVLVIKLLAYSHTGSAAMLSEAIHSLADLLNQVRQISA